LYNSEHGKILVMVRKFIAFMMLTVVPASLVAADSSVAMMYAYGPAAVNGLAVQRSSAIFPGDRVRTNGNSVAKINASGVNVQVLGDSEVKFEGSSLLLDSGTVAVSTSKRTSTRVGEMTITPATQNLTEFQVTESKGKVMVLAHKGDVSINQSGKTSNLAEGARLTRFASSDQKSGGATPAAGGGVFDSPIVIGIGVAAVAGLVTWVLVQGSEPASATRP
jgi:hypothetical protein